jgi:heterotetrameric sarcosine oxidase gamma subunit
MTELVHLSIAAQIGAADPAASAPGVTVRLVDPGRMFFVSGTAADLAPNELRGDGPWQLWLAPDRALLVGVRAMPEGFAFDVTDGLATFEIAGPRAAEMVVMGCTLDPLGPVLAPGRCAQTVFAGVKAVIYAPGARDTFRLHADRSLAAYLLEWFIQAASALQ